MRECQHDITFYQPLQGIRSVMRIVENHSKRITSGRGERANLRKELREGRMNETKRRPDNRERTQRRKRKTGIKERLTLPHFQLDLLFCACHVAVISSEEKPLFAFCLSSSIRTSTAFAICSKRSLTGHSALRRKWVLTREM